MLLKNKLDDFKSFLNTDSVLTTLEERYCYAEDASNLKSSKKIPDIVVFVKTIEEVQKIVKYANEHNIPIISRGAGTNMVGACVCNEGGIVLNFSRMNKIIEINSCNMTATVQPGVILGDLKDKVEKLNLFYPPDPSNYKVSTIGGSIAQSSSGAVAFKYGTTKDYVLSLKVVTATGELMILGADTVKDATGYHLAQLFVGSEGTLGIIVEATLKLIPLPEEKRTIMAYYNSAEDAMNSINEILKLQVFPASIDYMDQNSIKTVENYSKANLKSEYDCLILIDLDGNISSMDEQIEKVVYCLNKYNSKDILIAKSKAEANEFWDARRVSFSAATKLAPDVTTDDIIVPRNNLAKMINLCHEIVKKYNLQMCLVGHVGDGNLHPQIVLNMDNEEEFRNYTFAKAEIYQVALELGGTISAEHGIGLEKKIYLENTIDKNALNYMKYIKKAFDPKNILNPGKIFEL